MSTSVVDTSIRLLSQRPLSAPASTARVLEVASVLDQAGMAALEVTGGGCFDAAVARGTESPWERLRAIKAHCPNTPLQMALRGRFLVGSRPVGDDLVRRFILCAAESGIDIFRLHDPLNDVENLAEAAAAVRDAGCRLYAGLAFSGRMSNLERVLEKSRRLAELGAHHVILHDPAGALDPGTCGNVVAQLHEASGVPVGLYCQGTGGNALAMAIEAARNGAEPIATAVYPVAGLLNRVSTEMLCRSLEGLEIAHGVDTDRVWEAARMVEEHVTSQIPALPIPPRIALRTAFERLPVGLVGDMETRLRAADAVDRLDDALEELQAVRDDCGTPPLAQPVGGILAGQAVRHVLSARRWAEVSDEMAAYLSGAYGRPPMPVSEDAARFAGELQPPQDPDLAELRAAGQAASEEDLLLLALFGDDARRLLETIRGRGGGQGDGRPEGLEPAQSDRIRELIRLVEGSDVGELTIEDGALRITVRKQEERSVAAVPAAAAVGAVPPEVSSARKIESPMVGTFYRSPSPSQPPFVSEGDQVEVGQTLCVLEAMKLFNEFKSPEAGTIRRILVENAAPVEFGQTLFELEPA